MNDRDLAGPRGGKAAMAGPRGGKAAMAGPRGGKAAMAGPRGGEAAMAGPQGGEAAMAGADAGLSRAQRVYERLKDDIRAGALRRGERVREEAVARALGVSRTPVREALARLQARGLLEVTANGLVVATISRTQTLELYAMREVLEGSAARFAAQHAAPGEAAVLARLSASFADAFGDPGRLAALNRRFHAAILDAAHNRYLVRMLEELSDALALLPGTTFELAERGPLAVSEHAAIVEAIAARDPDAAERAARLHIQRAQEARLTLMQF